MLAPYDPDESTTSDAGVLAGFLLTDQKVGAKTRIPVPVLDHGRVKTGNLPVPFTPPTAAVKAANTQFVWV